MSTPELIQQLQKRRNQLLRELLTLDLMIPGAFKVVYRKCGKENCWCCEGGGHSLRRITWSEQGASRSKAIPKQDVDWIESATSNYRKFRGKRREILELDKILKALLDDHEKVVVKKSRLLREYL